MELEKELAIIFNTKDIENIEVILSHNDLGSKIKKVLRYVQDNQQPPFKVATEDSCEVLEYPVSDWCVYQEDFELHEEALEAYDKAPSITKDRLELNKARQCIIDAYEAGWTDMGNIDEPKAEQYYTDLTNQ